MTKLAGRVTWYWERLLAMSPEEVKGRVAIAARKRAWRRRSAWRAPRPSLAIRDSWQLPEGLQASPELLAEAEATMRGEYAMLNLHFTEPELDWHHDPQFGVRTPLGFGPDMNFRDPQAAGNVKNIWEKNRHQHLTVLALAFALTGETRYADEVGRQLTRWAAENPFPRGVNWNSMLELGVRLLAWVWIERLLRGSSAHTALFGSDGVLWAPIYWHQWIMARHESFGSSANNHLTGEVSGLYTAATVWPVFPESAHWASHAKAVLEREIGKQTFPSGLNREQAASYHLFTLELFWLPAIEGDRAGAPFSAAYHDWLRRQIEVMPRLTNVSGALPRFGDADEGLALRLTPAGAPRADWLYLLGRAHLDASVPCPSDPASLVAATLVAGRAPAPGTWTAPTAPDALEDAGYYVLTSRRGRPDELFCLADAGPLGYLSIAGHGHADALSFTLDVGGRPILVDPGTYIYLADPAWRAYFRSTRAHNTVLVNGQDQSVARGPFLWGRQKARARALAWEPSSTGARLVAEHDGYTRLSDPVVHRRTLTLDEGGLSVEDTFTGTHEHALEWRLHFAPDVEVTLESGHLQATWPGGRLSLPLDPRLTWRLARAESDAGWYSPGFNVKVPTTTLIGTTTAELPRSFNHRITITT